MKSFLKIVMIAFLVVAGGSAAHAVCKEEAIAAGEAAAAAAANFRQRQTVCAEFRLCKAEARRGTDSKQTCKHEAREAKFLCMQGCKSLKGGQKKQCKRGCRQDKRVDFGDCRNLHLADKIDCRDNNPQCMELQDEAWELNPRAIATSAAYYACLRKNAKEAAENPETQEDAQDAEDAANSEG